LFDWSSPAVAQTVEELATADLAVIASPTYKATYTGLLKLFLDRVGAGQLEAVTVVPLMLAADSRHALAGEVHLKPLLNELGASCPTPALLLRDDRFDDPAEMSQWLSQAKRTLGNFS
jgi:FMN reductase